MSWCWACPDGRKVDYETAEDTARAEAADIAALVQQIVGPSPWNVADDTAASERRFESAGGELPRRDGADSQPHPARCARAHLPPGRHPVPRRGRHVDLRIARGVRAAAGAACHRRPDEPTQGRHRAAHLDLRDRRPSTVGVPPRPRVATGAIRQGLPGVLQGAGCRRRRLAHHRGSRPPQARAHARRTDRSSSTTDGAASPQRCTRARRWRARPGDVCDT